MNDQTTRTRPACSTCGRPATHGVVDTNRYVDYRSPYVEVRPAGPPRYGCADHPETSKTFQVDGPPPN